MKSSNRFDNERPDSFPILQACDRCDNSEEAEDEVEDRFYGHAEQFWEGKVIVYPEQN
jgi:hypothetical protein